MSDTPRIKIFTEGNDMYFIARYIKKLYPSFDLDITKNQKSQKLSIEGKIIVEIIPLGGKDKISSQKKQFEINTEVEGINLVIFDADSTKNEGGYELRQNYLTDLRKREGIEFELFLFPNNESEGDLETLLEQIINPTHQCIFDCFEKFQTCIHSHKDKDGKPCYKTPILKTKIYSYADTLTSDKIKDDHKTFGQSDYFFDNPEYWDLDHAYLEPLKKFVQTYIDAYVNTPTN